MALQGLDDAARHNCDALLTGETRSETMRDEALLKSYGAVRGINRHALALAELAVSSPGVMARALERREVNRCSELPAPPASGRLASVCLGRPAKPSGANLAGATGLTGA